MVTLELMSLFHWAVTKKEEIMRIVDNILLSVKEYFILILINCQSKNSL